MRRMGVLGGSLAVLLGLLSPSAGARGCALRVWWEQQPPYGVRLPDGRRSGYYAEAVREAARRMGCTVDFLEMPWVRGLAELEQGRLDLVAGAVVTPERERFARFTRPIDLAPTFLFLTPEAAQAWPLPDLGALATTPLTVGVERGARYGEDYVRHLADPAFAQRLHPVADLPRGWRMLREGRLDGILSDQSTAFAEGLGLPSGPSLVPVLLVSAVPVGVMVGRHLDVALFERLDRAFDAMIAEGWLPQLREAWIPCQVDPGTMGCRTGERIEAASPPPGAAGGWDEADLSRPSR